LNVKIHFYEEKSTIISQKINKLRTPIYLWNTCGSWSR